MGTSMHASVVEHCLTNYPVRGITELGYSLGPGRMGHEDRITKAASVLTGLRVEPDLFIEDFACLNEINPAETDSLSPPAIVKMVRKGVFTRSLSDEQYLPATIYEAVDNAHWGVFGDSGDFEARGAGFLLEQFLTGMRSGGYSVRSAKQIMREDIEQLIVRECDGRTSYTAISAMRYANRVMGHAGLHDIRSRAAFVRRSINMFRKTGMVLPG